MFRNGVSMKQLTVEIMGQDESAIVLHIALGEAKKGVFGFEVADLQGTMHLGVEVGTTGGES